VLTTVIFLLQVGFTGDFVPDCSLKCVFGSSNFHWMDEWTLFTGFCSVFMSLDRKFNGNSKNVLKTVIFSLQVGFTGDFVLDCGTVFLFYDT